jgi:hypothetical protein
MRPLAEITRLIEIYPPEWRRWCSSPENGGCACRGCVRVPAPSTVRGDPEYHAFPNPDDRLTAEEVAAYRRERQADAKASVMGGAPLKTPEAP